MTGQMAECVICLDQLVKLCGDHTWFCTLCSCEAHLYCMGKWLQQQGKPWGCPQCSRSYYEEINTNCSCVTKELDLVKCLQELPCGHFCQFEYHNGGDCPPCTYVHTNMIKCKCEKTYKYPPNRCGDTQVKCPYPCSIPKDCGHPALHSCHSKGDCPRCTMIVKKMCVGKHREISVPCYRTKIYCGGLCGNLLSCGVHKCKRSCHSGECDPESTCKQLCGRKLRKCSHSCALRCHQPFDCESMDIECTKIVNISCECGKIQKQMVCTEYMEQSTEISCNPTICLQTYYSDELLTFCQLRPQCIHIIESLFEELIQRGVTQTVHKNSKPLVHIAALLAEYYGIKASIARDSEEHMLRITLQMSSTSRIPNFLLSALAETQSKYENVLHVCFVKDEERFPSIFKKHSDRMGIAVDHTKLVGFEWHFGDFLLFFEDNHLYKRFCFSNDYHNLCDFRKIAATPFQAVTKRRNRKKQKVEKYVQRNTLSLTNSFLALRCE